MPWSKWVWDLDQQSDMPLRSYLDFMLLIKNGSKINIRWQFYRSKTRKSIDQLTTYVLERHSRRRAATSASSRIGARKECGCTKFCHHAAEMHAAQAKAKLALAAEACNMMDGSVDLNKMQNGWLSGVEQKFHARRGGGVPTKDGVNFSNFFRPIYNFKT